MWYDPNTPEIKLTEILIGVYHARDDYGEHEQTKTTAK